MNFSVIVLILAFVLATYLVLEFAAEYRAATGTPWDRAVKAADGSATKLWAKFVMLVGSVAAFATNLADYLNDPTLSAAIKNTLRPSWVAYFMVGVAVITILARNRTK